jgi:hypothetical protein
VEGLVLWSFDNGNKSYEVLNELKKHRKLDFVIEIEWPWK